MESAKSKPQKDEMVTFSKSREARCGIDSVWEVVSDVDNDPRYYEGLNSIKNVSKNGNVIERQVVVGFLKHDGRQTVTLTPKKSVEVRMTKGPMTGTRTTSLARLGDSKTGIEIRWDVELRVPLCAEHGQARSREGDRGGARQDRKGVRKGGESRGDEVKGRSEGKSMKSLTILVPVVGLCYFALFASFLVLRGLVSPGGLASYQLFFIPLATVCALSALGIWYKPAVGHASAIAISIILILIFFLTKDGNDVVTVLSNPNRNPLQFIFYLTTVPTFFTTIVSSAIGILRKTFRGSAAQRPSRA
jgi:hypothetical protein